MEHKLDSAIGVFAHLFVDTFPELVVKVSDLLGNTDPNANPSSCRERARGQVWPVSNFLCNIEHALPCLIVNARPSVQGTVHRANGHAGQFGNLWNTAAFSFHRGERPLSYDVTSNVAVCKSTEFGPTITVNLPGSTTRFMSRL